MDHPDLSCGIACCLGAAAIYLIGRGIGRNVDFLKSVTRVNQLGDLAQLLDVASKVLPLVVEVSGRVGSDTPINCEYSGLRGVIVKQRAEQHFLKHNKGESWKHEQHSLKHNKEEFWKHDSILMLSTCKEVPWYLDDGTARVHVVGARSATGLVLTEESEVFEESGRSLVCGTSDDLRGLKMLGVKRIERVLSTGTPLTIVGEAVKDDNGSVRIQRPHNGPFFVSDESIIDQFIANHEEWSSLCKYASIGLAVFGICLLANHAIQYIMARRRHREMRKRALAATAESAGQEEGGSKSAYNDRMKMMPDFCVICLEQKYNSLFVPCGHVCCCMACSSPLTNCPLCRRQIDQAVWIFRR